VDQLSVEKKGIPTVTIVTTPYETAARTAAKDQGVTDFSLVAVEHPIAGYSEAEVRAKAEAEFPKILQAATQWQPAN
jgi:hypothetical protein